MKRLIKRIYESFPYKQRLFRSLQKFYTLPEAVYSRLNFTGAFDVAASNGRHFKMMNWGYSLENHIFWQGLYGAYDPVSLAVWERLCARSGAILDVGANTGLYSLVASTAQPNAVICALEPMPAICARLEANILLNQAQIRCRQTAISDIDGSADILHPADCDHSYGSSLSSLHRQTERLQRTRVSTTRLDTLVERENLECIDLLKIDVEGHESEVFRGMGSLLSEFRPTILVEVLDEQVAHQIEQLVGNLTYNYFNINENKGLEPEASLSATGCLNHLICSDEVAQNLSLGGFVVGEKGCPL